MPGRARADAWPLVLAVLVVTLGVGLAAVTPRLAATTEHDAVSTAVREAGDAATVVVSHDLDQPLGDGRGGVVDQVARLADGLDAAVAEVLPGLDPRGVRTMLSRTLPLTDVTDPRGETAVRFVHVWHADGPDVTWVAGRAPAHVDRRVDTAGGPAVRVVEVGVSEATADFLGVGPGDVLPSPGVTDGPSELRVAGVFRADDPADRAWSRVPELLRPAPRGDEVVLRTALAVLCSAESLPDAIAASPPGTFSASYTYHADPEAVADAGADVVVRAVGAAVGNPATLPATGFSEVRSELPTTLTDVLERARAARAQAGVLVGAVAAGAVVALVLAAALLAARRRGVLAQHRARGGSLPAVAGELLLESVPVAALGAALGLAVASAVAPGPVPWVVAAPVVLAAVAGPPALGTLVAAGSAGGRRRTPAAARRRPGREAAVRRVVAEVATLAAAAGAVATAHARGVADGGLGVALAPVLTAVAGALVLLRAVPWLLRAAVRAAGRSRHTVPILAVGRARAATRALPFVGLTVVVALGAFAGTVGATIEAGREQASWDAVGADVTAAAGRPAAAPGDVATAAERLAAAPGVDAVAAVRVEDLKFRSTWGAVDAHLVAVHAADLEDLAARSPVGGPTAARLAPALDDGRDGPLPALVSDDLLAHGADGLGIRWSGSWVPVTVVGRAPALDGRRNGLVVVDLAALDAAVASDVPPNVVWAVGAGAADAVATTPELRDATVELRATWLDGRRSDPLLSALTALVAAAAVLLALLAVAVVVLAAAGGAPDRRHTLATLSAVGVSARQAGRIALGELAPLSLLASVGGVLVGVATARVVAGAMDLHLVTGQAGEPTLVPPWWVAVPVAVVAVTVLVVVRAEGRRRERLGQVLRIGGPR